MQCQSYFPVHYSHYDLNLDANGGASPMYNGNTTFRSGHYNEYVAPLQLPRGPPLAYKDLLRQTMLLQEDTFKNQVQELHRLYRRQKELMGQLKNKEMCMNRLHIEDSNSSSARYGQNVLHNLPLFKSHCTPSIGRVNIQTSISFVREPKPIAYPVASNNGVTLNDLDFAESKGRKIKGKILDLELPAEVYIDSDEEESLQATPPTTLSPNKRAKVVVEPDVKPFAANRSLNSVLQRELLSPCSSSQISSNLADLNKPLTMLLEEGGGDKITNSRQGISEINHDMCNSVHFTPDGVVDKLSTTLDAEVYLASSGFKSPYILGQNPLLVQALPSLSSQFSFTRAAKIFDRQEVLNKMVDASQWCSPNSRVIRSSNSNCSGSKLFDKHECFMSAKNLDLNHIDLNSVDMSNPESTPSINKILTEGETVNKSKRCRMIDINLPCDLTADDELHDLSNNGYSGQLNLDCCLNDDALLLKSFSLDQTRLEIDLEEPFSPEIKERVPPRGGSEGNQPEEGSESLVELAKVAAEAIVSISSSNSRSYPESMVLQKCEACNLEWFAGLVSSLSIDVDTDFETITYKETCIVDDYEAMTLELTEMKVDDHWGRTTVQISSSSCSLLPCEARKGRTRRSKRKDFQREVLPSLASLSRYEVTEDMQMIEGLMEAAGTPWQLSRTRRACRMGRKPRVPKQESSADEVPELMAVMSWGKVNRRSRGRRSPASPTVLLKWFEYGI